MNKVKSNMDQSPNLNERKAAQPSQRPLILASSSPRRRELLAGLGLDFIVQPSHIAEEVDEHWTPAKLVQQLALQKAKVVADQVHTGLVIGADTIVVLSDKVLGKPKNEQDAFTMLKQLQGNFHQVYSGIALYDVDQENIQVGFQQTKVKMKPLSDTEIRQYIDTGEPMDKAGSYAIQGIGATLIEEIAGDYFTVVGLPLSLTSSFLKQSGIDILQLASIHTLG